MGSDYITKNSSGSLDKAGILCSVACAIHCMVSPILVFVSPAIASILKNEWLHIGLLTFLTPIAIFAFYKGFKVHKKIRPLVLDGFGVLLLLSAVAFESLLRIEIE